MDVLIVLAITGAAVWWLLRGEKKEETTPVEPTKPVVYLTDYTKAQLIEYAEQFDIEVKKSWTKEKILSTIIGALADRIDIRI